MSDPQPTPWQRARARRFPLVALGVLAFAGLDRLLLRPMLVRGTEGDVAPFLARILDVAGATAAQALPAYENIATRLVIFGFALSALAFFGPAKLGFTRFFDRYVGEASAEVVGFLRAVTGGVLFLHIVFEDIAGTGYFPESLVHYHGFFALFMAIPGVADLFLNPTFTLAFEWVVLGVLLLATLGVKTRVTMFAGSALYLICAALIRQPSWSFHLGLIPWYALTVLAFFPAGDALSVDAWLQKRRGQPSAPDEDPARKRRRYGWARFAWVAVLTVPYFEAGLSKLSDGGLFWGGPNNMRNILYTCSLNDMQFSFDLGLKLAWMPNAFYSFLGFAAVYGEVAMILTLFHRAGRFVFPAMMFFMHAGIVLSQNILFWDLMVMLAAIYALAIWDKDGGPWDPRPLFARVFRGVKPRPVLADAKGPADAPGKQPPRGLRAFAFVGLVCWLFCIEFFPLTAMQMFSRPRDPVGLVQYYELYSETESGVRERARPDDILPALRAPRFRRAYRLCWSETKKHICEDTFARLAELHAAANPDDPIAAFELRHIHWDFLENPDDPDFGELHRHYRFDVAAYDADAATSAPH